MPSAAQGVGIPGLRKYYEAHVRSFIEAGGTKAGFDDQFEQIDFESFEGAADLEPELIKLGIHQPTITEMKEEEIDKMREEREIERQFKEYQEAGQ